MKEFPAEGLVDRVRATLPLVAASSFEAEAQRRPLDEVISALEDTGVFRSFVPKRHGGYEIDMQTYLDIGVAVAEADPSMGWITTFYMEHNWLLGAMFSAELVDQIFSARPYLLAPGTVNANGRATPHPDGSFTLTGQWQFATGICHADWAFLSGTIEGDEPPMPRQFLVPVEQVEVKDTWHVDGMAATGSRDIVATGVLVPPIRASLSPPPALTAGPDAPYLLRIPIAPMLSLTAAIPALGAARRALALFGARLHERIQFGTKRTQSNRVPAQVKLANLTIEVDAAETLMRDIACRIQAHAEGEATYSLAEQQQQRLAIAHIVRRCRDIVRSVLESSGASAHFLDNELQRIQRDVHMISAHTVFDVDLLAEAVGRALVAPPETQP